MSRRGVTLIELIAVISIIALLVALSFPAVQAARESARQIQCQNNLRQIGAASQSHHDAHGHFPSGGWGWHWAGESDHGVGPAQPGGWAFALLPQLEQGTLFDSSSDTRVPRKTAVAKMLQTPVATFYCPTRRRAAAYPYSNPFIPSQTNSDVIQVAAKTDYAANAGDGYGVLTPVFLPEGPPDDDPVTLESYSWPQPVGTGVVYVRSRIRIADIFDGTSHTIFVGEKSLPIPSHTDGDDTGDNQSCFIGHDYDIARWTDEPPRTDDVVSTHRLISQFGSTHARVAHFVMCDGSSRPISYAIAADTFRSLGNRKDGRVISP
jgi:prepilin-type N-terminal cleavage/methylation domain-containing protein